MLCTQVEELVGTPVGEQMLSISSSGEQLDSHARLSDYPEIRNRSELLLSQLPTAAPVSVEEKRKRKADSVLSMAKMFQAGSVPGASLSALQEESVTTKATAKYATLLATKDKFGASAGLSLSAVAGANLMSRAKRAQEGYVATQGRRPRMPPRSRQQPQSSYL
jgi:hypothetical protein